MLKAEINKVMRYNLLNNLLYRLKYPVVLQYDRIDCAPAALLSILRYYGGNTNLVKMRELCRTNLNGSTMLDLVNAANLIGFEAVGASGEYEYLVKEKMPCIAHVVLDNLQHFIVINKLNHKYLWVSDPGRGHLKLSREEFLKIWQSKSVVLLKPGKALLNENTPRWYKWVYEYIKKEESWVYQSIFLGIVYIIIGLLVAQFIQLIIDKFIPGRDFDKVIYSGIFLLTILMIKAFSGYFRQKFLIELNKRISVNINKDFLSHLFKLPKKFFDTRRIGDVTARIDDAIKIQQAILKIIGNTIIDLFIIVGSLIFMFQFSVTLSYISIIVVPLYATLLFYNIKQIKNEQNEVMKSHSLVESNYIDSLGGIEDIKGFNTSESFSQKNQFFFKNFQEKIKTLGLTQSRLSFWTEVSGTIITIGILIYGSVLVMQKNLLLGEMMASFSLLANMLPAVNRLVDANISLQGASISVQRLRDMLLVKKEISAGKVKFNLIDTLEIKNGSFSWKPEQELLKDISIKIKKGVITSLLGPSGSGKSTLVQLLQRKYNFNKGEILIDDINAERIELEDYRKNIGVVPQNIKIFNGTLLENILAGRTYKDPQIFYKNLKDTGLEEFLKRFENGVFAVVGEEGRKLSGGEKQLLAIARAMLDKPAVLIIDEGLSGIDIDLEELIFSLISQYAESHAVLLITHNIKTILRTNFVYLIENGTIIQKGNPADLITEAGQFKDIWERSYSEILNNVG